MHPQVLYLLKMFRVESVREPQDARELVHPDAVLTVEDHVRGMRLVGQGAPVIAGDVADNLHVVVRQPENLGEGLEQVEAVLVVSAEAHEDADIVQEGRHPEQQPVALFQRVLGGELVEELRGQPRHAARMRFVVAVPHAQHGCAVEHMGREVGQAGAFRGERELGQQSGPQGHVWHDHDVGGRRQDQMAVHEHRGHERFRLDRREPEPLDERCVVALLDLFAEREKRRAAPPRCGRRRPRPAGSPRSACRCRVR